MDIFYLLTLVLTSGIFAAIFGCHFPKLHEGLTILICLIIGIIIAGLCSSYGFYVLLWFYGPIITLYGLFELLKAKLTIKGIPYKTWRIIDYHPPGFLDCFSDGDNWGVNLEIKTWWGRRTKKVKQWIYVKDRLRNHHISLWKKHKEWSHLIKQ